MSRKITLDIEMLAAVYPEVRQLPNLPRKKKKMLKKEISKFVEGLIERVIEDENLTL